jgi:DNA-binding transcriptional LysR family regulator
MQKCKDVNMNNWDDIRFFLAVTREGSVSGAAKFLDVNHSTVTRRIQSIEKKNGVRLFTRQQDGYAMTEAAYMIVEQASAMENNSKQISRSLLGLDSRAEGPVNLTMPHDLFEFCLAEELADFQKNNPGIQLNLQVSQGLRDLAKLEADLAVRLTPNPPEYLIGRQISKLQHALYTKSSVNLDGAVGIITWSGATKVPAWASENFPEAYIALQVDDLSSMYAAVKAGFGVARMPCYMPDSHPENSILKLPISLPISDWGVWVLNHVDLSKTLRIKYCSDFLYKVLYDKRNLFEGRQWN